MTNELSPFKSRPYRSRRQPRISTIFEDLSHRLSLDQNGDFFHSPSQPLK